MTPSEELALYTNDHAAWCRRAAPWWAQQIAAGGATAINQLWPIASDTLSREIWPLLSEETRVTVRAVRAGVHNEGTA